MCLWLGEGFLIIEVQGGTRPRAGFFLCFPWCIGCVFYCSRVWRLIWQSGVLTFCRLFKFVFGQVRSVTFLDNFPVSVVLVESAICFSFVGFSFLPGRKLSEPRLTIVSGVLSQTVLMGFANFDCVMRLIGERVSWNWEVPRWAQKWCFKFWNRCFMTFGGWVTFGPWWRKDWCFNRFPQHFHFHNFCSPTHWEGWQFFWQ